MALLCTFFAFKYITNRNFKWLLLLLLIGFLSVVSDRLFLMLFTAPMLISCLLMFKPLGFKTTTPLIITILIFSWVGLKVFKQIDSYPWPMLDETKAADYSLIRTQSEFYIDQMIGYLLDFGFMALTMYLFIISVLLMGYVFFKTIKDSKDKLLSFYALFSVVFSICVILAPLAAGKYEGIDCLRYNVYPFYLSILSLTVFVMFWQRNRQVNKVFPLTLIALNLLFFFAAVIQISPKGIIEFFSYYPLKAQQMDAVAEKEHLKLGVANYWDAKVMTMFSKKGVKVRAVFDNLSIHQHVGNDNWYFDNMFNFVVVSNFNDTSQYRSKTKDIQVLTDQQKFKVVKTHTFTYLKFKGGDAIVTN